MALVRTVFLALALFVALPAFAQSRGQFALPDEGGGVRRSCKTSECSGVVTNPFWHGLNDTEANPPAGFTFVTSVAITAVDLRNFCSAPEDYTGTGTRVVTVQSGTLPTGITLTTSTLAGTPTADNGDVTFRCTLDAAGTSDNLFTFTLEGTDTTAPPVPTNLVVDQTVGFEQTSLTITFNEVSDASGILRYPVRYALTEALCNSTNTSDNTLLENSPDGNVTFAGLSAGDTRWIKVRAQDNALNQSAFTQCVSGTTDSGGGGGGSPGTGSIRHDDFEGATYSSTLWNESSNTQDVGDCLIVTSSTGGAYRGSKYLSFTLNSNADDAAGGTYRCELNLKGGNVMFDFGGTYYYGVSFRIPGSVPFDTLTDENYTQWHVDPATAQAAGGGVCHYTIQLDNNIVQWNIHGCDDPTRTITNVTNNGSGLVRITSANHLFPDERVVTVAGVNGATGANGTFTINLISANTFDLLGSTFGGSYTNGGTAVTAASQGTVSGSGVNIISPVARDAWFRVCTKIKPTTAMDGIYKVWINADSESDAPVKNFTGRTIVDQWDALFKTKIGIYKPVWRTNNPPSNIVAMSPRIVHVDDFRIGVSFAEACQ